jgi:CHAT domain-containing protein
VLPRVDRLREELRDTMALARGRVPRLREFAEGWGRDLLPEVLRAPAPEVDVVVVVPHAFLHDVPFHLVRAGPEGETLGSAVGISYASGRSLFVRCASRNPARARDAKRWSLGPSSNSSPARPRSLIGGGADVLTGRHEPFRALARSLAGFFDPERVTDFGDWPYSRAAVKAAFRGEPVDAVCVVAHGYTDLLDHRMSGLLVELDPGGIVLRAIPLHGGRHFDFRDLPLRRFPATVHAQSRAEVLTAAELEVDGHIETQLVVLLACSAGWGRVLQGDEPASLAESFLHIGAPSVLAPMWDSDYEPTGDWIRGFFEGWVELGYPKALAARHVTRRMEEGRYAGRPERLGAMAMRGDWL